MTCIKCPWHCRRVRLLHASLWLSIRSQLVDGKIFRRLRESLIHAATRHVDSTLCSLTWPLDGASRQTCTEASACQTPWSSAYIRRTSMAGDGYGELHAAFCRIRCTGSFCALHACALHYVTWLLSAYR